MVKTNFQMPATPTEDSLQAKRPPYRGPSLGPALGGSIKHNNVETLKNIVRAKRSLSDWTSLCQPRRVVSGLLGPGIQEAAMVLDPRQQGYLEVQRYM